MKMTVATSDACWYKQQIRSKQDEVSQYKREIKNSRRKLRTAAAELNDYKRQLARLGIEYIGVGDNHGRH